MTIPDDRPHSIAGAEVTVSLDDGGLYVRQDGPSGGTALLLIHGNVLEDPARTASCLLAFTAPEGLDEN